MDREDEPYLISDLADLTGVGMRRVEDMPEPYLLSGLRRILQEAGDLTEHYSAFDNVAVPGETRTDPDHTDPVR